MIAFGANSTTHPRIAPPSWSAFSTIHGTAVVTNQTPSWISACPSHAIAFGANSDTHPSAAVRSMPPFSTMNGAAVVVNHVPSLLSSSPRIVPSSP